MQTTEDLMAQCIGLKITITATAVYCSIGDIAVTVGYKFTGGDIAQAIRIAIEKTKEAAQ
jgi:hypothetical protein